MGKPERARERERKSQWDERPAHGVLLIGRRVNGFGFKRLATENRPEAPNDRDRLIVRQANFGKE